MSGPLDIIYRDDRLVAINKPAGLLVHRTFLAPRETRFAVQLLRDQIGKWVYPIHRLDKATSGVLLFGLSNQIAQEMGKIVLEHAYQKEYIAIVRGWPPDELNVDHTIPQGRLRERKEAFTRFVNIEKTEIPHPVGPFDTARYSLIKAFPESGRRHQIRRHLRHVSYPIAGDRLYGDRDHNRFFRETLDLHEMFLHATEISFTHPTEKTKLTLHAPLPDHWIKAFSLLGFSGMTKQNEADHQSKTPEQ